MQRATYHISFISKKIAIGKESALLHDIVRRYTPEVVPGKTGDFYFELTGLRTFFKMDYETLLATIKKSIESELHHKVEIKGAVATTFDSYKKKNYEKTKTISTYKEIRNLLSKATEKPKSIIKRRIKLTVPFLGKVD